MNNQTTKTLTVLQFGFWCMMIGMFNILIVLSIYMHIYKNAIFSCIGILGACILATKPFKELAGAK
jgi:hypothetical protein